jgi:hypothetical protein
MDKVQLQLTTVDRVARPDAKGRVALGDLTKGVSSYKVFVDEASHRIVLEPFVEIPAREAWLFENREALSSVRRGLEQSAAGQTRSLGSFAEFLTDEDD